MLAPPELEQIHPLGKSPIVTVTLPPDAQDPATEAGQTLVLAESGFIAQYLTEHFAAADGSTLLPKRYRAGWEGRLGGETDEWMRYQYYLHYAEGSLMPPLLVGLVLESECYYLPLPPSHLRLSFSPSRQHHDSTQPSPLVTSHITS